MQSYLTAAVDTVTRLGIKPKGLIDVGANVGEFITLARKHWPSLETVLAFEPNAYACQRLQETQHGVTCFPLALGDEVGTRDFYTHNTDPYATGNGFYKEQTEATFIKRKVPVTTLDAMITDEVCEVIKLDCQGAELEVLGGAFDTLGRSIQVVICELSFFPYNQGGSSATEVISELITYEFSLVGTYGPNNGSHRLKDGLAIQVDGLFVKNSLIPSNFPFEDGK